MFIFQKTYTRNGLFKGRKNFLVVTASTYVKLQQAYFSESNKAGGWELIGYAAPNNGATTNFAYGIGAIGVQASTDLDETGKVGWTAMNLTNLNECQGTANATAKNTETAAQWKVTVKAGSNVADVAFDAVATGAGCIALTPSFDKIGK